MRFHSKSVWPLWALSMCAPVVCLAQTAPQSLQEIVVTASLRDTNLSDLAQSVTVLDDSTLKAAVQQFYDWLHMQQSTETDLLTQLQVGASADATDTGN